MILGNVREEHPSGLCPRLINGVWKVALSEAYTRSHNPRTVTAMPTAGPFTAAINGFENSMYALTNLLRKIIHTVYNMTRNLTKSVMTLMSRNYLFIYLFIIPYLYTIKSLQQKLKIYRHIKKINT